MAISATGIGSGLDVESLVGQLVMADIQPAEQRINRSEASYQAEISAYGVVKGALASFQSAASTAASVSQYQAKIAATSSFTEITSVASSVAAQGDYELEVSKLAASQSLASSSFTSTADQVGLGTLTISVGTSSYDSSSDAVTSFVPNSDTTDVTVSIDSSNNSLAGVRDAINASGAAVSASIVNDGSGYRLALKTNQSGLANAINISVTDSGDSNNTDASGLSRLAFNTSVTNLDQTKASGDAALTVNGLAVSSSSNTITSAVEGVTFSLKEITSSPVTITVSSDKAKAQAAFEGFINEFNELTKTLNSLTNYDASGSKGSLLTGDATLRTLASNIRSYLNTSISNGSSYTTLAELGVTTNVSDGTLEIDSAKLQTVLDNDPTDIARVLAGFGSTTNSNVRFSDSTSATEAGTYAVVGSESPVSSGSWTAGVAVGNPSFGGLNNARFSVSVDGLGTQTITVSSDFDTNADDDSLDSTEEALLVANIQASITSAFGSAVATVSIESGKLKITSATLGAASAVSVTADSNAAYTEGNSRLGITSGASAQGTSTYSYTMNGTAASLSDGVISGTSGTDVEGLQLQISGNAVGDLGTVSYTRGIALQVDKLITDLLASDGLIQARLNGLNNSVDDLVNQRDELELRATALERRYRDQFTGLETLISSLNTTQSFLTTALSQFVDPLSFKK